MASCFRNFHTSGAKRHPIHESSQVYLDNKSLSYTWNKQNNTLLFFLSFSWHLPMLVSLRFKMFSVCINSHHRKDDTSLQNRVENLYLEKRVKGNSQKTNKQKRSFHSCVSIEGALRILSLTFPLKEINEFLIVQYYWSSKFCI